jgi:hypothetical protein
MVKRIRTKQRPKVIRRKQRRINVQPTITNRGPRVNFATSKTANVQRSLGAKTIPKRSTQGAADNTAAWAMCRMNPWAQALHSTPAKAPMGSGDATYTTDVWSFCDISWPGTASFVLRTLPTLPITGSIMALAGIPGVTLTGNYVQTGSSPITAPGAGFYAYNGALAPNVLVPICNTSQAARDSMLDTIIPPYQASKARILSQAWKITYTGPAQTCQGIMQVTSNANAVEEPVEKQTGRISYVSAAGVPAPVVTDTAVDPVMILPVTSNAFTSSTDKNTVVFRPEAGGRGLVKRNVGNDLWPMHDIWDQSRLLVTNNTTGSTLKDNVTATFGASIGQVSAGGSTMVLGSIQMMDDTWNSSSVACLNMTGSVRFEVITCYEFAPDAGTVLYDVSSAASTSALSKALADKVAQNIQAQPLVQSGS